MNEHEAQRIAAATHELRPDWPASSLLTLIRKSLIQRPRRDVMVAFAWVACEPGTSTPARVLEAGPWWRAAGVEGDATHGPPRTNEACLTCGKYLALCACVAEGLEPTTRPIGKNPRNAEHAKAARAMLHGEATTRTETATVGENRHGVDPGTTDDAGGAQIGAQGFGVAR